MDKTIEPFVGQVNAMQDGFDAVLQIAQKVIDAMVKESKLVSGKAVLESSSEDSCWVGFDVVDADTLEKIYLHYRFKTQNA